MEEEAWKGARLVSVTLDALKVSDEIKRLNPRLWGVEDTPKSEAHEPAQPQKQGTPAQRELRLQNDLEAWLVSRGYGRRTPKKMQEHHSGKWFVHLARPKGNPILLDILLLWQVDGDIPGHYEALELELKAENGRLSPDQNSLILRGEGAVAWNLEQAKNAVKLWETAVRSRSNARVS